MHPGKAAFLVVHRRCPTGLVVGDDQLAVVVEVESVDDAAQRECADGCLQPQLETDVAHHGGVFHAEVGLGERPHLGVETGSLLVGEVEQREIGIDAVLGQRLLETHLRRDRSALPGRVGEQQFEHAVYHRALGGVHARRLGQLLDAGETECHRA